jgi:formyltetrahydrofolate deformylase
VTPNHPTLESVADEFRIPFFALPVSAETKRIQEKEILPILRRHHVERGGSAKPTT